MQLLHWQHNLSRSVTPGRHFMKRVRQDKVRVRRAYLTAHDLYAVAVVRVRTNNQKMHRNKDRFVNTLVFMLIFLPITWTIGRATYAATVTRAPFMKVAPAIALGIVRGVTVSSVYMLCHVVLAYWQGCADAAQAFAGLTQERWHQGTRRAHYSKVKFRQTQNSTLVPSLCSLRYETPVH
jgi:hypothetical protein